VRFRISSAWALLLICEFGGSAVSAQSAISPAAPGTTAECALHVYPGAGLHSVGEDFDAVHGVDQDLHHYYSSAGRALDWLTPSRQAELLRQSSIAAVVGTSRQRATVHDQPVSRADALASAARTEASGCLIEVFIPQLLLERGGLTTRSLRVFGIVRRYEAGSEVHIYSGYASAPMMGFRLESPSDVPAATHIVEAAYVAAVSTMLSNSDKSTK